MKPLICGLCVVFAMVFVRGRLNAQTRVWQPTPGHTQIPIWPGVAPDALPVVGPEWATAANGSIAGKPCCVMVEVVSQPTMTVYSPEGVNTGVAVVVFPGGGYIDLAIDLEGTEVCDWLISKGITCVLLKYRVPGEGPRPNKSGAYPDSPVALQDAQRVLGLTRLHADEWHVDPHKIGVLGFSAGGHLVAAISTNHNKRLYPAVDAADKESCRPDFAVALYPGHLLEHTSKDFELNPYVPVTPETPPTFIVHAQDDPVDTVKNSLVYYDALRKAGVPTEIHLYAYGGHAFGLRRTESPVTWWPQLVETWLKSIKMIP